MITLYQFDPAFGLSSGSPFCAKLDLYMRMAGIAFEIAPFSIQVLHNAPKGKLPYINDNGKVIADSSLSMDHLKAVYGDPLDAWLTQEQRATALAFQRLMEENLYFAVLYTRWIVPQGWEQTRKTFFDGLKPPLKWFLADGNPAKNLNIQYSTSNIQHPIE